MALYMPIDGPQTCLPPPPPPSLWRLLTTAACRASEELKPHILTVGSLNVDIIVGVDRLPVAGETLMARTPSATVAVGGKGANQAVAAARLSAGTGRASRFVTQFGNDSYASMMEAALLAEGVDVSACGRVGFNSGQGIVRGPRGPAGAVPLHWGPLGSFWNFRNFRPSEQALLPDHFRDRQTMSGRQPAPGQRVA